MKILKLLAVLTIRAIDSGLQLAVLFCSMPLTFKLMPKFILEMGYGATYIVCVICGLTVAYFFQPSYVRKSLFLLGLASYVDPNRTRP